jgi:DNA-binding transcriptional regulator YiaG
MNTKQKIEYIKKHLRITTSELAVVIAASPRTVEGWLYGKNTSSIVNKILDDIIKKIQEK